MRSLINAYHQQSHGRLSLINHRMGVTFNCGTRGYLLWCLYRFKLLQFRIMYVSSPQSEPLTQISCIILWLTIKWGTLLLWATHDIISLWITAGPNAKALLARASKPDPQWKSSHQCFSYVKNVSHYFSFCKLMVELWKRFFQYRLICLIAFAKSCIKPYYVWRLCQYRQCLQNKLD